MRIRLGAADRERLGAPEWLDWPPKGLMQSEAEVLQEDLGVEPDEFHAWLQGQPVKDADGNDVQDEVDVDGEKALVTKRRRPAEALRFRIWQALRRAGVRLDYSQVDFDRFAAEVEDNEPAAEPGKDAETTSDQTTTSESDG